MSVVNSVNLVVGGPAVHVTVLDENSQPVPPGNVTWSAPAQVSGSANITIVPDATGFLFSSRTGDEVGSVYTMHATYAGPLSSNPVDGPTLTVTTIAAISGLQYASP